MKRLSLIILSVFLATILLGGCQTTAKKPVTPSKKPTTSVTPSESERRIMASKFASIAESVSGVKKATVVVESAASLPNDAMTPRTEPTSTPPDALKPRTTPSTPKTSDPLAPGGPTPAPNPAPKTNMTKTTATNQLVVMVGLTLTEDAKKGTKERNIKDTVVKKIKDSDKRVSEVLVSTNVEMVKKINDVATGILEGKPVKSTAQDIKELNRRLRTEIKK